MARSGSRLGPPLLIPPEPRHFAISSKVGSYRVEINEEATDNNTILRYRSGGAAVGSDDAEARCIGRSPKDRGGTQPSENLVAVRSTKKCKLARDVATRSWDSHVASVLGGVMMMTTTRWMLHPFEEVLLRHRIVIIDDDVAAGALRRCEEGEEESHLEIIQSSACGGGAGSGVFEKTIKRKRQQQPSVQLMPRGQ